jgi:hypothetical protein
MSNPSAKKGFRIPVVVSVGLLLVGGVVGWQLNSPSVRGDDPRVVEANLKDSCGANVLFFGARGSDEPDDDAIVGFGRTVYKSYGAMSKAFRPLNVVAEPVDYAAVSVLDALKTGGADYVASRSAGFESLLAKLGEWYDKCPNYKFVLAGYSQGADVVGDVMADLIASNSPRDKAILGRVVAAAMIGDPRYNPADPSGIRTPTDSGRGILSFLQVFGQEGLRPVWNSAFGARVRSWCLVDDLVCDSKAFTDVGNLVKTVQKFDLPHFHYPDRGITDAAGQWLAQMANATLAPPTATDPVAVPGQTGSTTTVAAAPGSSSHVTPAPASSTRAEGPPAVSSTPPRPPQVPPPGEGQVPPDSEPGQEPLPAGAVDVGRVDLEKYCQDDWRFHAVVRFPVTWGWRCAPASTPASGNRVGDQNVDVDRACSEQHGDGSRSHYRNYTDPRSWFCWKV